MYTTNPYTVDTIKLKKIMLDNGVNTNEQLSDISGINRNTIGKILAGKIRPSSLAMDKLVSSLNIPLNEVGDIFFAYNLRIT